MRTCVYLWIVFSHTGFCLMNYTHVITLSILYFTLLLNLKMTNALPVSRSPMYLGLKFPLFLISSDTLICSCMNRYFIALSDKKIAQKSKYNQNITKQSSYTFNWKFPCRSNLVPRAFPLKKMGGGKALGTRLLSVLAGRVSSFALCGTIHLITSTHLLDSISKYKYFYFLHILKLFSVEYRLLQLRLILFCRSIMWCYWHKATWDACVIPNLPLQIILSKCISRTLCLAFVRFNNTADHHCTGSNMCFTRRF